MLVEQILDRLSVQDLVTVGMAVEAKRREKLAEAKQAVLEEMRGKLEALGLTLADVLPARRGRADGRRSRRNTGQAIRVKYRSPEGDTWSGRGHLPKWLQVFEEQGRSRDEFLVRPDAE
jgi:DNA-binding protein H-NS